MATLYDHEGTRQQGPTTWLFMLLLCAGLLSAVQGAYAAQSITITKINGVSVPPDEVYTPDDVITVEWSAIDTSCGDYVLWMEVYVDNVVKCTPCGSGSSGSFQLVRSQFNNQNCSNSIQIKAQFNAPSLCIIPQYIYSQPVRIWTTAYKDCTGQPDCNRSSVGKPVDVATGKMYHEMTDLSIDGPLPITFARRYDNLSTYNGPMGYGWQHSYSIRLESGGTNRKVFVDRDGRKIYFSQIPQGGWDENRIEHLTLSQPGTPPWRITDKHQTKYNFDSAGKLTSVADRNGNTVTLGYTGSNLTSIADNFGRSITVSPDANNRIQTISAGGRSVTYTYSASGNLERVDYSDGSFVTYEYTGSDIHDMTAARDSYGRLIEKHTYSSDKVQQTESDNGNYLYTLAYNSPGPNQTTVTNSRGVSTVYTHDSFNGLVTASIGPGCASCGGGTNATLEYDRWLNLRKVWDGEGTLTEMTYDTKGNMLTMKEAAGTPRERTWTYTYNSKFNFPATITIPSGGTCSNPNKVITNTFNGTTGDRLTEQVKGCNGGSAFTYTTTYTYDSHGQIKTINGLRTDVSDVTTYDYYADGDADVNRRGRLQRITNALSQQITYNGYDLFGNVGSIIDPNNVETAYLYNYRNLLTETRINGAVPADDIVTENYYDLNGNLDYVRLPNCVETGPSCTFSQDYVYDTVNRLKETHDALGNKVAYSYDTEGNRTREEYRDSAEVVHGFSNFLYDDYNRLAYSYFNGIIPENTGSIFYKYGYFADGMLQSEQDPEGHVTSFAYDELNRVSTVTQTVGADTLTTTYGYDIQNNLTGITDPKGLVTSYSNSDMNWQLSAASPDTGATNHAYDPAGNLTSATNANGITINRTYDALNRVLTVTYPDSSLNVTYSYDSPSVTFGVGHRTGMTDPSGITTYYYDQRGLLKKEEKTISSQMYTTQFGYDKTGNLTQILYPTVDPLTRQGQADFSYDAADRVSGITAKFNGVTTAVAGNFSYKPFGPRTQLTFGNGLIDTRTYGTRYQLGSWTLGTLLNYDHVFNNDLNLTSRTDNLNAANNRTFGYDEAHRLTQAAGPWGSGTSCTGSVTYTYDKNGNRLCKGESLPATAYAYNAGTNRLNSASGEEAATYTYDNNGNTTGDGTHTYGYSHADRLAAVDSGTTATYTYDGEGRRVIKTAAGITTYYLYDPLGKLLTELVPAAGSGKDYVYLLDTPIARVDWTLQESLGSALRTGKASPNVHLDWTAYPPGSNEYIVRRKQVVNPSDKSFNGSAVIATVSDPVQTYDDPVLNDGNRYDYQVFRNVLSEALYFYHTDHLGTPIAMTNTSGALVWKVEHRPFGGMYNLSVSSIINNLRFPGQYFDAETGLHYNYFRYYNPQPGKYLTPDPIGLEGGIHLFAYVENNPINADDPLGLDYKAGPYHTLRPGTESGKYNCMAYALGSDTWQPESYDDPGNRDPNKIPPRFGCRQVSCKKAVGCNKCEHKVIVYEDESDWKKWHVYRRDSGKYSCKYGQGAIGDVKDPNKDYRDVYEPKGKVKMTCWCCPNKK